jgi:hypothetical protein
MSHKLSLAAFLTPVVIAVVYCVLVARYVQADDSAMRERITRVETLQETHKSDLATFSGKLSEVDHIKLQLQTLEHRQQLVEWYGKAVYDFGKWVLGAVCGQLLLSAMRFSGWLKRFKESAKGGES